jgi:hypothetical protein
MVNMNAELMEKFFDEIEKIDESSDDKIYEGLVKNKELIKEISASVEESRLFLKAKEQFDVYVKDFYNRYQEPKKRVVAAYIDLLTKITDAPTSLHMRGSITLIMPLLNKTLSLEKVK